MSIIDEYRKGMQHELPEIEHYLHRPVGHTNPGKSNRKRPS